MSHYEFTPHQGELVSRGGAIIHYCGEAVAMVPKRGGYAVISLDEFDELVETGSVSAVNYRTGRVNNLTW